MLELARHIEILLLDNDCVIVPGLGGFVTHHIPARRVEEECKFLPPYRTLGFSPKMQLNDGLLVQSYMQAYDTNYPSALRLVEDKVEELRTLLQDNGSFDLHGIGTLRQNMEGDYNFTPLEAGLLSPTLYGLSSFEMKSLEMLNAEQQAQAVVTPVVPAPAPAPEADDKTVVIHMSRRWLTGLAAACITLLVVLALSFPTVRGNLKMAGCKPLVEWINDICKQETIARVEMTPSEKPVIKKKTSTKPAATVPAVQDNQAEKETISKPEIKEESPKPVSTPKAAEGLMADAHPETPYYTIVMVSSITLKNAERFAREMAEKGFTESKVLQKDNLNRVVFSQFPSESAAWNQLRTLRSQSDDFTEAWVLKVK